MYRHAVHFSRGLSAGLCAKFPRESRSIALLTESLIFLHDTALNRRIVPRTQRNEHSSRDAGNSTSSFPQTRIYRAKNISMCYRSFITLSHIRSHYLVGRCLLPGGSLIDENFKSRSDFLSEGTMHNRSRTLPLARTRWLELFQIRNMANSR